MNKPYEPPKWFQDVIEEYGFEARIWDFSGVRYRRHFKTTNPNGKLVWWGCEKAKTGILVKLDGVESDRVYQGLVFDGDHFRGIVRGLEIEKYPICHA